MQADTQHDVLTDGLPTPLYDAFEVQIFQQVAEAEEWLRSCQAAQLAR